MINRGSCPGRALIRLRHELPVLVDGDFTPLMADDPQIWAYARPTPSQRLLVIANRAHDPRHVQVREDWTGADLVLPFRRVARCPSPRQANAAWLPDYVGGPFAYLAPRGQHMPVGSAVALSQPVGCQ